MPASHPAVPSEGQFRPAPGRDSKSPLGEFPAFVRDQLGFLEGKWKEFGDVAAFRFGWRRIYLVAHPDGVRRVLQGYPVYFDKNLVSYRRMRRIVGDGLVTSDGDLWKRQHRIAQPAFEQRHVNSFLPIIQQAVTDVIKDWESYPNDGAVNIHNEMRRLCLRIAALSFVGVDIACSLEGIGEALSLALDEFMHRLYAVAPIPKAFPTPRNRRFAQAQKKIDGVVQAIIDRRRQAGDLKDDLLGRLMAATDPETGVPMTDRLLKDEIKTMFFAAYENTAHALTWTWLLLAQHPECRQKLQSELAAFLGGRIPSIEDIERLTYTKAVLQESMRLFTPVPLVSRRALQEDVIGGFLIPKNSVILISPFITHRHPEFWSEPDRFYPERFLECKNRHRFAYFPFGGGPRVCVGASFAMLEATLLIAALAQQFDLDHTTGIKVEFAKGISLRPRSGLFMKITRRHSDLQATLVS